MTMTDPIEEGQRAGRLIDEFLYRACLSYGRDDWPDKWRRAERIRVAHPQLALASIHTAVLCGERQRVAALLDEDPSAVRRQGGPQGWEPIFFLCYGRLPNERARTESLAIAELLLDRGADPNTRWSPFDGSWDFTALTGALGHGELGQPEHPHAEALARLLLDRGADANESQGLYNTHLVGDDTRWLDLLFGYGLGPQHRIPQGPGGGPAAGLLDYLLVAAVRGHRRRTACLLDHGADPNANSSYDGKSCYQHALLAGEQEIADLLLARGARRDPLEGRDAFVAAGMRLDRQEAARHLDGHREYLEVVDPLTEAAGQHNVAAARLFLELGMDPNRAGKHGQRALHRACTDRPTAQLLLAHGADARALCVEATAAGFAAAGHNFEMARFLAEQSRTLLDAVRSGHLTLARELIAADPSCVGERTPGGNTPLHELPADGDGDPGLDPGVADALARLLLEAGADVHATNAKGQTPPQRLRERGLDPMADQLSAMLSPRLADERIKKR